MIKYNTLSDSSLVRLVCKMYKEQITNIELCFKIGRNGFFDNEFKVFFSHQLADQKLHRIIFYSLNFIERLSKN